MRTTTVIRVSALLGLLLAAAPAAAASDGLDRVLQAVHHATAAQLPSRDELASGCRDDLRCSAVRVVDALGGRARLQRVRHPDTDTIRWVSTRPSIGVHQEQGALRVEILHLGRKVLDELDAVFAAAEPSDAVVLDLRQTRGGRFARMLDVASFFLGARPRALGLVERGQASWIDLPLPAAGPVRVDSVWIGSATASAGEVLAALIASIGGAQLCGREPTAGEATLKAVIPVDHDWRLLVEQAEIVVPHLDLRHGLQPSDPC